MVRTILPVNFCLSTLCFIFLTIPSSLCFVPSRISWLTGANTDNLPTNDLALQNYHTADNFLPYNSYRTSSMPLPLSRFMNVFNDNNNNNNNEYQHSIHHQYQLPQHHNNNNDDNNSLMVNKRGVRLCGVRLLKKMSAVCNNCIKSPDSSAITKRAGPTDMSQFAKYCCSTGCEEDDFKQYCC